MTPIEAAEGTRLLGKANAPAVKACEYVSDCLALSRWLWANREELVRCAELAANETKGSK